MSNYKKDKKGRKAKSLAKRNNNQKIKFDKVNRVQSILQNFTKIHIGVCLYSKFIDLYEKIRVAK